MPRRRRCAVPGIPQLVSLAGHNQEPVFHDAKDYREYVACMVEAEASTATQVHAFVLLPSRVLILCTPICANGVSRFMQAVGCRYTTVFNTRHNRSGSLWNGRFKASHVDPETHLEIAIRFVATLAAYRSLAVAPADYRWAGYPYRRAAGVPVLVTAPCVSEATARAGRDESARYEKVLHARTYEDIERSLRHELAIGSTAFKARLAGEHGVRVHLGRPGRPRKCVEPERIAVGSVDSRYGVETLASMSP